MFHSLLHLFRETPELCFRFLVFNVRPREAVHFSDDLVALLASGRVHSPYSTSDVSMTSHSCKCTSSYLDPLLGGGASRALYACSGCVLWCLVHYGEQGFPQENHPVGKAPADDGFHGNHGVPREQVQVKVKCLEIG